MLTFLKQWKYYLQWKPFVGKETREKILCFRIVGFNLKPTAIINYVFGNSKIIFLPLSTIV